MPVVVNFNNSRMQIRGLSDSPEIMRDALKLGGRFRHRTGMWSFPSKLYKPVMEFLRQYYKYNEIAVLTKKPAVEPDSSVM